MRGPSRRTTASAELHSGTWPSRDVDQEARVLRRDEEEGSGRAGRRTATLFPFLERPDGDAQELSGPRLHGVSRDEPAAFLFYRLYGLPSTHIYSLTLIHEDVKMSRRITV